MHRIICGVIAAILGIALVKADGINIPAPSWTYAITSLGTGIATALGVNVGTAGAPVINGGVLGTPSSGTATNLSGTAASLTAGTVTTNANLTGDVTSVGNATTLAASARLKSKVVTFTRDISSAGGSQAVTGVGFTPTACDIIASNPSGTGQFGIYLIDSSLAIGAVVNSTATTTVNTIYQNSIRIGPDLTGASSFASASVASFDADGFTLTWATKTGTPTGTVNFVARCLR